MTGIKATFTAAGALAFFRSIQQGGRVYDDEICITIPHWLTTKVIIHLPEGVFVADGEGRRLIPMVIDANKRPQIGQNGDAIIEEETQGSGSIQHIRVKNFQPSVHEQSDNCLYLLQKKTFLYTTNHPNTLFSFRATRQRVKLIFLSETCAWYQGDLLLPLVGSANQVYTYQQIVWVSDIATHQLKQVYLPIVHLPSIQQGDHTTYHSPSTLSTATVFEHAITFEQKYVYEGNKVLTINYMIDTSKPTASMALTDMHGFPPTLREQLLMSTGNLAALYGFIHSKLGQHRFSFDQQTCEINPLTGVGKSINLLCNAQTDTWISIGARLLWPLPGSLAVKGLISANIAPEVTSHADYLVSPAGVIKGKTPESHYFFWSVMSKSTRQLVKLYVQKGNARAELMDLAPYGRANSEVLNIKHGLITTHKGFIYRLSNETTLTLVGVNERFIENHPEWSTALVTHLSRLDTNSAKWPAGQTKAIGLTPHLTIYGLLQSDQAQPLSAWYDHDIKKFIICKADPDQRLVNLGVSSGNHGTWILDNQGEKNKKMGYVPAMESSLLPDIFRGRVLKKDDQVPTVSLYALDPVLGKNFTGANVKKKKLYGLTSTGVMVIINRTDDHQFETILLGVTADFTQEYADNRSLKAALATLCQHHTGAEIIKVDFQDDKSAWYQPTKKILFRLSATDATDVDIEAYLGFNRRRDEAYFVSKAQTLVKIDRMGALTRTLHRGALYQRRNDVLILNSGTATTLESTAHVDIDAYALVLSTAVDQREEATFTFDIGRFNYPVIYLIHLGAGGVHCNIPSAINPHQVVFSKKYDMLFIFIGDALLVVDNAFKATNPRYSAYHHKVKFIFGDQGHLSVKAMADHYLQTVGSETDDGHIVIPIPALSVNPR